MYNKMLGIEVVVPGKLSVIRNEILMYVVE